MLRTLTYKSKMNFGKYSHNTVADIINILEDSEYIQWVYYNMSNISFHKDILSDLKINQTIEKPGKNPDLFKREEKVLKELTIGQASYYKLKGEKTKKRKQIQSSYYSNHSKEFFMVSNRKLL